MENNLLIQYTIAGAIVALAILWVLWRLLRKSKRGGSACCGCALSEACTRPPEKRPRTKAPQCPQKEKEGASPSKGLK